MSSMSSSTRDRTTRTYRATGINLRSKPSGEADRLMTILTKEYGLIRVIAPSARKQKSSLSGRSGIFVVNDLLIAQGKSMDKITQAESLQSFPKLSLDIRKLTAGQVSAAASYGSMEFATLKLKTKLSEGQRLRGPRVEK